MSGGGQGGRTRPSPSVRCRKMHFGGKERGGKKTGTRGTSCSAGEMFDTFYFGGGIQFAAFLSRGRQEALFLACAQKKFTQANRIHTLFDRKPSDRPFNEKRGRRRGPFYRAIIITTTTLLFLPSPLFRPYLACLSETTSRRRMKSQEKGEKRGRSI